MTTPIPVDFEVIGHGGAGAYFPGNSKESLERAIEIGVDRIEIDVRTTADHRLVLVHDDDLRDDLGNALISKMPFDALRERVPGILSFDEAVEITKDAAPLLVDVKGRTYEPALITSFREHGIESTVAVSSTHARSLRVLRNVFPEMRLGLSRGHSLTRIPNRRVRSLSAQFISTGQAPSLIALARWCGATEVMLQHHICTPRLVGFIHRRGLRVYPWTVDEQDEMERLLALGVDGIISNRPDVLKATIAALDKA